MRPCESPRSRFLRWSVGVSVLVRMVVASLTRRVCAEHALLAAPRVALDDLMNSRGHHDSAGDEPTEWTSPASTGKAVPGHELLRGRRGGRPPWPGRLSCHSMMRRGFQTWVRPIVRSGAGIWPRARYDETVAMATPK